MPIGRPLAGTVVRLLDSEIYIAGPSLSRAYWSRPAQTAMRFLPDPFTDAAGGRLYRTGDRGRRLDDGNLEFFGRVDDQVKVRGFRVEIDSVHRGASFRSH